jgi:Fur family ferric uptake transcriptional regulator
VNVQPAGSETAVATRAPRRRLTRQRRLLIAALRGARRYLTARDLHGRLLRKQARIGLATVYRTLDVLRHSGEVSTRLEPDGQVSYLLCRRGHHHHAVCTHCGRVDDVPCRTMPAYAKLLGHHLRFHVTAHQVEFYGLCARCS